MTHCPGQRQVLSRALVALAGPAGPPERAHLLASAALEALGLGAEVVLLRGGGSGETVAEAVAGSDDGCLRLAELERDGGAGPALACARSGLPESIDLAGTPGSGGHLPGMAAWAQAASGLGWGLARAVPLVADGPAVGGLVLLAPPGHPPSDTDLGWAATLGGVAAAGLQQARELTRHRTMTGQLQEALESRIVIEQAKGVLAERGGVDPSDAFGRMRLYARAQRQRLHEVAREVVRGTVADAVLTYTSPAGRTRPDG